MRCENWGLNAFHYFTTRKLQLKLSLSCYYIYTILIEIQCLFSLQISDKTEKQRKRAPLVSSIVYLVLGLLFHNIFLGVDFKIRYSII